MTARALGAAEFGRLLRPLLPRPDKKNGVKHIAVAVSGGADSMALALLSHDWAKAKGVRLTAFIVDHGLRKESAAESKRVLGWLKKAGIKAERLVWRGAKPAANKQAEARAARYRLLEEACAAAGIPALLLGQHRDDQAETLLLRSLRGSGVDGLAAMAPVRAFNERLTVLRPLLDIPKARLVATLSKRGQPWVEDPSNADPAYMRARLRRALDILSDNDAAARAEMVAHLAQTARNFARTRALLDEIAYDLLHRCLRLHPAGIAWLDRAPLAEAHDEIALRALSRLLSAIGGDPLPPRLDRLERLHAALRASSVSPQTLHRCALRPIGDRILVCREARHLPAAQPLRSGLLWDGRFRVTAGKARGLVIAPLGSHRPAGTEAAVPKAAWPALPALWKGGKLLAVPALGWGRAPAGLRIVFRPSLLPAPDIPGDVAGDIPGAAAENSPQLS